MGISHLIKVEDERRSAREELRYLLHPQPVWLVEPVYIVYNSF